MKVKVIETHNSILEFETQLTGFCKDKEIIDIKYSTSTTDSGWTLWSALVLYN